MMIHGVQNTAAKSRESLGEAAKVAFWKMEGGGFIQDLYEQMNRLPVHESADLVVMGAFENARAMLTVMSKMHRTIAAADDQAAGYDAYIEATKASMKAMEARCKMLSGAVARKLPRVPKVDESLFSREDIDAILKSKT